MSIYCSTETTIFKEDDAVTIQADVLVLMNNRTYFHLTAVNEDWLGK